LIDNMHNLILRAQGGIQHVYIHVPFCRSRCHYCDFYFKLEKYGGVLAYIDALTTEINARYSVLNTGHFLKTLYFGGGTPSLLTPDQIKYILSQIQQHQVFDEFSEITLEMNPEDVDPDRVRGYLEAGINRFSIGIQSLDDAVLKKVARRHSAEQAKSAVYIVHNAMIAQGVTPNISVDSMYGLPDQSFTSYQKSMKSLVALPVQHISMYGLQLEEGTRLETLNTRLPNLYSLPDDDAQVTCYEWGVEYLSQHGFNRYEVSNFAKEGFESQHNHAYWSQKNYLALGPAAHGYVYPTRYSVVSDLSLYNQLATLEKITENEGVTAIEHIENTLIFGLRTSKGIDRKQLETLCSPELFIKINAILNPLVQNDELHYKKGIWTVNPRHIPRLHDILVHIIGLADE